MSDRSAISTVHEELLTEDPKAKLRAFILPIVFVILIAILLSLVTLNFYKNIPDGPTDISPFPEDPSDPGGIAQGAVLNMLFYVVLAFIGGVIVLAVIKRGFLSLLVYFFAATMGFSWFVFGLFYGSIILVEGINFIFWDTIPSIYEFFNLSSDLPLFFQEQIYNFFFWNITIPPPLPFASQEINVVESLLFIFALLLGVLGTISFGIQTFDKIWLRNLMMIFFGAMIGSMLAIHLGLLTVILILIGLSIYDIYAVFRGPLKGIIEHGRQNSEELEAEMELLKERGIEYERVPLLPALPVYSTPLINIGLGDFAFFSMLISVTVVISNELITPIPLIAALIGLVAGAIYTFKLLEMKRALPGLPLPILGGMSCLALSIIGLLLIGLVDISAISSLFF